MISESAIVESIVTAFVYEKQRKAKGITYRHSKWSKRFRSHVSSRCLCCRAHCRQFFTFLFSFLGMSSSNGNSTAAASTASDRVKKFLEDKDWKFYCAVAACVIAVGAGAYCLASSGSDSSKKKPRQQREVKKKQAESGKIAGQILTCSSLETNDASLRSWYRTSKQVCRDPCWHNKDRRII